jgi:hypothetical protein
MRILQVQAGNLPGMQGWTPQQEVVIDGLVEAALPMNAASRGNSCVSKTSRKNQTYDVAAG